MAERLERLARPYAKVAFDIAVTHDRLDVWQTSLESLAILFKNGTFCNGFDYQLAESRIIQAFENRFQSEWDPSISRFIHVVMDKGIFQYIPSLWKQFMLLRAVHDATLHVTVTAARPLSEAQQIAIHSKLEQKFLKKIRMICTVEPQLLAGVRIRTEEGIVIEGSLRDRLDQFAHTLQS